MKDLLPFLVVKTHWQPGALFASLSLSLSLSVCVWEMVRLFKRLDWIN